MLVFRVYILLRPILAADETDGSFEVAFFRLADYYRRQILLGMMLAVGWRLDVESSPSLVE